MPALGSKKRNLEEYISGYVDGEGCFSVSFSKRKRFIVGWETKPSFFVSQNYDRNEKHKNLSGLRKIINLAFKMNTSGRRRYSKKDILNFATTQMKI